MKTLVLSIFAILAISFAQPALATNFDDCNGNATCIGDDLNQTNNDSHDTTNAPVANGGQGGQGGDGFGLGIGVGKGGSAFATGGDAEVEDSGNSSVGNGYGNFSPESNSRVDSDVDVDTDVDVDASSHNFNSNSAKQGQGQDQDQDQFQAQGQYSDDDFVIEGDTTTYEAARIPVNSAAPVFAGACSQGVSMQFPTAGASAGTGNPVCDYVAVAGAFVAAGERAEALRVLGKAEDSADWRAIFAKIRGVLTLGLL